MNIRNSVYVYVYLDCYKRVAIVEATRPLSSLSSPLFSPPFFFFSILVSLSLYWRIHYHRGIFLPNLLDLSMPRECDSISSSCVDIIKGREEEYKQIYLSIYIYVCVCFRVDIPSLDNGVSFHFVEIKWRERRAGMRTGPLPSSRRIITYTGFSFFSSLFHFQHFELR